MDLDRWAQGLVDLAESWDRTAYHCGDPTPPESPCAIEARRLPESIAEPAQLMRAVAQDAAIYVSTASQHLRALAKLTGPEIVLTGWSLTRSVAEHCGRVAWLLAYVEDPLARVARFYMERVASTHYAKMAAAQAGRRAHAKALREDREQLLSEAQAIFPDAELFSSPEKINDWSIGDEPYAGLAAATDALGKHHLNTKGLYSTLSAYTHPSVRRLRDQMKTSNLGDRQYQEFEADLAVVHWQVGVASGSVYRAACHVTGYLTMSHDDLEAWADGHEDLLSADPNAELVE